MSVVAFDGKQVCADKMSCHNGMKSVTTKLFVRRNHIVGFTGCEAQGLVMVKWFEDGADLDKWPPSQSTDDWARLIVVTPQGHCYMYEKQPARLDCALPIAFGAGRDFAMGAMLQGASAFEACLIASQLSDSCGMGIDVFKVEDLAHE